MKRSLQLQKKYNFFLLHFVAKESQEGNQVININADSCATARSVDLGKKHLSKKKCQWKFLDRTFSRN